MSSSTLSPSSSIRQKGASQRKLRHFKDRFAAWSIGLGGVSVIAAVCLIFFYLLYEVMPLFKAAHVVEHTTYASTEINASNSLHVGIEEQNELGYVFRDNGEVTFFDYNKGAHINAFALETLSTEKNTNKTVSAASYSGQKDLFAAYHDGQITLFKPEFKHEFDQEGVRTIHPLVQYPYGTDTLTMDALLSSSSASAVSQPSLAVRDTEEKLTLVLSKQNQLLLQEYSKESGLFSDDVELVEEKAVLLPSARFAIQDVLLGPDHRWLYIVQAQGVVEVYDLWATSESAVKHSIESFEGRTISSSSLLLGGNSLLLGDDQGRVYQYSMIRDDDNRYHFKSIRAFQVSEHPIVTIEPEQRRKGFIAIDSQGTLSIFNTTAERRLIQRPITDSPISQGQLQLALSPRSNRIFSLDEQGEFNTFIIDNEHPELSWKSVWQKVWYEGYAEPEYIWQSSASNNDFEPKYSLMPLAFGTLKAAVYAMLLAIPLAICGAIYTAYFMAPALRAKVKPAVELMEALPTVILGFLAGLWLAPLLEDKLPGIFAMALVIPVSILLFSLAWTFVPARIRHAIDEGWQPVLLIPVIIFSGWLALSVSGSLEVWLFGGNIRMWLTNEMGIGYDQRNALVVGLAMGFAVIPTIFSIAEDALFAVPKHLSYGSLALGATPWQTVIRVVLPTASPGIFSAIMIGFGRAVGETMIVLMATGNTPIMEMNIFEGLRTLSANIAVEMPEAEKDSTHYRILFLAALVLFMFTFLFNTTAEYIRQRLREKYGNL